MKHCPQCSRKYSDAGLNFCLEDGAELRQDLAGDDFPTEVFPPPRPTTPPSPFKENAGNSVFQQEQAAPQFGNVQTISQTPTAKPKTWLWVLLILGCLVVVCGGGGLLSFFAYLGASDSAAANQTVINANTSNNTNSKTPEKKTTPEKKNKTDLASGMTLANYNRLEEGMTYKEVTEILGGEGELMRTSTVGAYKNDTYKWSGENYSFVIATFQNDKLLFKSEYKLE